MIFTICFISALIFLAYVIHVGDNPPCNHTYKIIESQRINNEDGYFLYNLHTLQCTKCGKLKVKKIQ